MRCPLQDREDGGPAIEEHFASDDFRVHAPIFAMADTLVSAIVQLALTALTLSLPIPNGCIAPCTAGGAAEAM